MTTRKPVSPRKPSAPDLFGQDDSAPEMRAWKKTRSELRRFYGEDIFEAQLEKLFFSAAENNVIYLGAPTRFSAQVAQDRFAVKIAELWRKIDPDIKKVFIGTGDLSMSERTKLRILPEISPPPDPEMLEKELLQREKMQTVMLPLWPTDSRGVPNVILRGALFAAIHCKSARYLDRALVVDEPNFKIKITGKQLTQSDLEVWEHCLSLSRLGKLGSEVSFSAHSFLKDLQKNTGAVTHQWLEKVFVRLMTCGVEITFEDVTYAGTLLEFWRNEKTKEYKIKINQKIGRLYNNMSGWTQMRADDRKKIGPRPLALWMQGYISSHARLYPMRVDTFHRLSGSNTKCMRKFKQQLKQALQFLTDLGFIQSFKTDEFNLVHIINIPSHSQQRHLEMNE